MMSTLLPPAEQHCWHKRVFRSRIKKATTAHHAPIAAEIAATTRAICTRGRTNKNDHMVRAHPWSRHSLNRQLKRRQNRQNLYMNGLRMASPPPAQAKACRLDASVSAIIQNYRQAQSLQNQ